mmetsp:Transcript_25842/g.45560  ORF Transcript_25842/g.45560 Transcript_25842/m.45560 type:complete len:81 (+) Transcript_25842:14-256(+)
MSISAATTRPNHAYGLRRRCLFMHGRRLRMALAASSLLGLPALLIRGGSSTMSPDEDSSSDFCVIKLSSWQLRHQLLDDF